MRKLVFVAALGALSSLALVACGGGGSSSSTTPAATTSSTTSTTAAAGGGAGGGTVNVEADPSGDLAYTQTLADGERRLGHDRLQQPVLDAATTSASRTPSGKTVGCHRHDHRAARPRPRST